MQVPEGQDIGEIIQEMDYNFTSPEDMPDVDFLDTEIRDYEIKDVK